MGRPVVKSERFLLLELPSEPDAPIAWRRLADGVETARGDDLIGAEPVEPVSDAPERIVAVAPAADVTINFADLPGLAPAQARAAARLLASENSIASLDTLHVAVGLDEVEGEERLIATVDRARMDEWLGRTRALGYDPDAIVPSPLLLPRPDEGYVRGHLFGQSVLRSHNNAFLDDDLAPLIVRDAPVTELANGEAEAAMLPALAAPPVNLRQGDYAKRERWAIDWRLVRRLALLGAGIALALLLTNIVRIVRYDAAADATRAETRALAAAVTRGQGADPVRALDERLAANRGGGAGFAASTAAIFAAVRAVPNVELTLFDFGVDGTLRIGISATSTADLTAFQRQLEAYGFDGTATAPAVVAGRQVIEMTVKLP